MRRLRSDFFWFYKPLLQSHRHHRFVFYGRCSLGRARNWLRNCVFHIITYAGGSRHCLVVAAPSHRGSASGRSTWVGARDCIKFGGRRHDRSVVFAEDRGPSRSPPPGDLAVLVRGSPTPRPPARAMGSCALCAWYCFSVRLAFAEIRYVLGVSGVMVVMSKRSPRPERAAVPVKARRSAGGGLLMVLDLELCAYGLRRRLFRRPASRHDGGPPDFRRARRCPAAGDRCCIHRRFGHAPAALQLRIFRRWSSEA